MSWANSAAAIFLALIPAVTLLYFLRLKRREVPISSTLLWSRVLEDRRVNSPFQRFRKSLLLLLQILVILFLVGALAQPRHETVLDIPRTHILLVDCSASMATREGGESRLERAVELAENYVKNLASNERAVVIRFAERARTLTANTDDVGVLRDGLSSLEIVPGITAIDDAIEDAMSIARNLDDAIAVVFSDGGFPPWEGDEIPLPVEYVPVGEHSENSGIVALASRLDFSRGARPQVFVEVRNFGPVSVEGVLSLMQGNTVVRAAAPTEPIPPGGKFAQPFEADVEGLVRLVWEPDSGDSLELDNTAWLEIEPPREATVWHVGGPNYFLDRALEVLPGVDVVPLDLEEVDARLAESPTPPQVIIWDRVAPERLPDAGGHLFVGAVPASVWADPETVEFPAIISWDRAHPVNRFLGYSRLRIIENSYVLTPETGTTPIVNTSGGALVSTFSRGPVRGIVVGFDVLQSDWPLDISFSLFFHNAIGFLTDRESGPSVGVRAEQLLSWRAPRGIEKVRIERPDGRDVEVAVDSEGWVRYPHTDALGPYHVVWEEPDDTGEMAERQRVFPVNLLSARESNVQPRAELHIGGRKIVGSAAPEIYQRDFWPWLLAIALAFLMWEWYCYHLR